MANTTLPRSEWVTLAATGHLHKMPMKISFWG